MPDDAFQSLTGLGFTELEAEVYVALLRHSPATGYRVAQSLGRPAGTPPKGARVLRHRGAGPGGRGTGRPWGGGPRRGVAHPARPEFSAPPAGGRRRPGLPAGRFGGRPRLPGAGRRTGVRALPPDG